MKFRMICTILIGLIILSTTFGCAMGSDNTTANKKLAQNISSKNSTLNSTNKTINETIIYVDQARGSDENPGTSEKPKKSIKSALGSVDENGIINVASGEYSGTENTNLKINKSITINGQDAPSTTIKGNNNQIWHINANKTVSINGFTFINGKSDKGGAIFNLGNLNIDGCIFKNNVGIAGAAIYNINNLKITNSNFSNNTVNSKNGIDDGNGSGGAIYTVKGLCNITGCNFENNVASENGGAINNNCDGDLVVVNTKFKNNKADYGGALLDRENCDIRSCEFYRNKADLTAGAIFSIGNLTIDDTQFNENAAQLKDGGGRIHNR